MIIDCVSDLHGYYPTLEGGDLLIVSGDLTGRNKLHELSEFKSWLSKQKYKKIIVIAGNHDGLLEKRIGIGEKDSWETLHLSYLEDSGTEFEGLKIWGSPWTAQFPGINPHCCAFTVPFGRDTEDLLYDHWNLIPSDIDILITHSPPYGILDKCPSGHVGSKGLYNWLKYVGRPKLHVFGHIHESYGKVEVFPTWNDKMMISVNASIVNERYEHVNKPIRIQL